MHVCSVSWYWGSLFILQFTVVGIRHGLQQLNVPHELCPKVFAEADSAEDSHSHDPATLSHIF